MRFKLFKRTVTLYFVSVLLLSAIFGTHLIKPVSAYSQAGDANGDNQVDVWDLYLLARSWYWYEGDPRYNPNADFNDDGCIDLSDLIILADHWYEGVPRPEDPPTVNPGYATVSIYPSLIEGPPPGVGDNFTVYIKIENVTDLYALNFGLSWDPTVLKCTKTTLNYSFFGSGIKERVIGIAGTKNNSIGEIYPPDAASLTTDGGVTGNGTLFQVKFTVLFEGSTWLNFTQLTLINSAGESIPFDFVNSYYSLYQPEPHGPMPKFSYSSTAPFVNETVNFDASSSLPGWNGTAAMPIISYSWDFGDGATATGVTVNHTYTSKGIYTVTLNATDSQGLWNITTKAITVSPQQTTVYVYPSHILGDVGDTFKVYINIEGVEDLFAWAIGMSWNSSVLKCLNFAFNFSFFGPEDQVLHLDGTINNSIGEINPPYAAQLDPHPWPRPGVSGSGALAQGEFRVLTNGSTPINLMIDLYNTSFDNIPYQVVNGYFGVPPPPHGPTAHFTYSPNDVLMNVTTTFDALVSSPGWDGIATIPIANYTWYFGDGTPIVTETDPVTTHNYTAEGTYTVTLTVTDEQARWNATSQNITVLEPHGPTAVFTYSPPQPIVNATTFFNATLSRPGWNLNTQPIINYEWDFGDGTNATTTNPTVTHTYTTVGNYTITLSVTDTQGNWNTITQTMIVNLAEFSLVTLYTVHLDLNYWSSEGANLTVAFYTYDGVYQGNTTVWTYETPTRVELSTDIAHPQGNPIEVMNLVLTDNSGNVLQTVTSFVMRRSHLMEWLLELDQEWISAPPEQRSIIFMEILVIDVQWPYAPP